MTIISHELSFRCGELCLSEALYPAPLARPKAGIDESISFRISAWQEKEIVGNRYSANSGDVR